MDNSENQLEYLIDFCKCKTDISDIFNVKKMITSCLVRNNEILLTNNFILNKECVFGLVLSENFVLTISTSPLDKYVSITLKPIKNIKPIKLINALKQKLNAKSYYMMRVKRGIVCKKEIDGGEV